MNKESAINQRVYNFSKTFDIVQTVLIYLVAILIPTFLGQILKSIFPATSVMVSKSQLIIGSIVNTALITSALNLKGWGKILGVVTMPSISTILGNYVFGTSSIYMVYMIPAIWIGNFSLVYLVKFCHLLKNKNYFVSTIAGIIVKVAVIFLSFIVLKSFGVFPEKMINTLQIAMSTTQVITATVGMILSFGIYKIEINKKYK